MAAPWQAVARGKMFEKFANFLSEILREPIAAYSIISFGAGVIIAGSVATANAERETVEWAAETANDCAQYHKEEFITVGHCLREQYEAIRDERHMEAAAEQYP